MKTWVYAFSEGSAGDRDLLGGKGANLAEMTSIGLPVPPGFTISTEACNAYLNSNSEVPAELWEQVQSALIGVETSMGREFGNPENPLLLSVRSGARFSMPGMMDTVLNLGLNDDTVKGLTAGGDERFAWDCYRRLIQMFSNVVMGVSSEHFEDALDDMKRASGVRDDNQLSAEALRGLTTEYRKIVLKYAGKEFPYDPMEQLRLATIAVFDSWNTRRARNYRAEHDIPDNLGTAVNIQTMVYGNMGDDCATGVAFTRNPSTGETGIFGEFLTNAQGEDVVSGVRTPQPIAEMADNPLIAPAYAQLLDVAATLEAHYRDMQDLEFTIQSGTLFMLQTRTGKRTGRAAVNIAMDMVEEGVIDRSEAVLRVEPQQLDQLLHPMIDPDFTPDVLATGLPASPGAATGKIVFDADKAKLLGDAGNKVILVRVETSPEDFHGMVGAQGILTARGGMTSHAAVVARGMGKPCVAGCAALDINYGAGTVTVNGRTFTEDDDITIDGATGRVMAGSVPTIDADISGNLATILDWADAARNLGVRANADTPHDAAVAREFGAEGIGLCRTEHMFFEIERLQPMREMILASSTSERRAALDKLLEMQRVDFEGIFKAMDGLPVTIRTLDPPLHEFLPHNSDEIEQLAKHSGITVDQINLKLETLREANPMLGHRGCRLGISYPEVTEMQARAIIQAALNSKRDGITAIPEIMIPLVADVNELSRQRAVVEKVAEEEFTAADDRVDYLIGTMIELPRAALTAGAIATEADFFSFGTNDLTQTTFGLSRDDAGRFLPYYVSAGIFPKDPFVTLDRTGVGELVSIAAERGKVTKPNLKLGICGEHGGDPDSVEFCHQQGLDYVSCSPFRVPVARLAAAQAAIKSGNPELSSSTSA